MKLIKRSEYGSCNFNYQYSYSKYILFGKYAVTIYDVKSTIQAFFNYIIPSRRKALLKRRVVNDLAMLISKSYSGSKYISKV